MTRKWNTFVWQPWISVPWPAVPERILDVWSIYEIDEIKRTMLAIMNEWICSKTVQKCLNNMRIKLLNLWATQEEVNKIYVS